MNLHAAAQGTWQSMSTSRLLLAPRLPLVMLPTESDDLTWDNDPLYQVVKNENAKIRKGSLGIEERAKCKTFFDQETDLDHNNGDVTGDKGLKLFCP